MTLRLRLATMLCCGLLAAPVASPAQGLSANMLEAEAAVGREDYEVAARYFEAECRLDGPLGCYNLAIFAHQGKLGARDPEKAAALNRRACDLALADGCANLAVQLLDGDGVRRNVKAARSLLKRACNTNSSGGCYALALVEDGRYGGKTNPLAAQAGANKACTLGNNEACYRLGFKAARQSEWGEAADWYRMACDAGNGAGCNARGEIAAKGRIALPDGELAQRYFVQGCERHSVTACRNLAELLRSGALVPVDEVAAQRAIAAATMIEGTENDGQ